jgi:PAS domain S-box-containing protein
VRRGLTFRTALAALVLGLLAIGGFGAMTFGVQSLRGAGRAENQSMRALAATDSLEERLLDLETGLRGYLISTKPAFLRPYQMALASYPRQARELDRLLGDQPGLRSRVAAITAGMSAYVRDWAQPRIREVQDGHLARARGLVASGGGRHRVDRIRAQFNSLTNAETRISAARTQHADQIGAISFWLGVAGMIVSGLVVLAVAVGIHRAVVVPVRRLAVSAGELSARVPPGGAAEVGQLTTGFNRMTENLEQQHVELEAQQSELEAQQSELEAQQIELEQALNHTEEQKAQAEFQQRFGERLAAAPGVDAASEVTLREIADAAQAEIGAVYLYDERPGLFVLAARRGLAAGALPAGIRPGDGAAGRALAERRIVRVSSEQATMQAAGLGTARPAVHELYLPLGHGERVIGVVCLGRSRDEPFAVPDVSNLADVADQAAVACAEAQSVRQVQRAASELETLLGATDEGIYTIDTQGRITLVNQAALRLTGYRRDELLGRDSHQLLHHTRADGTPYPREECPTTLVMQSGTGSRTADEVFWRRDGTSFPVEYSTYPLFDGDEVTGAVNSFTDITHRKLVEQQESARHEATKVLADAPSGADARSRVIAAVCEQLGLEIGIAWTPEADGGRLRAAAWHVAPGFDEDAARLRAELPAGEGPPGIALDRREPVLFRDLEREPPRRGMAVSPRLRSALAVPVAGATGNVVAVGEFCASRELTEPGLAGTLTSIGYQIAEFLERERVEAETQRMKDDFVATVSHELRTPLTSIDGWLHILLGGEPGAVTDEQEHILATVKRNSDRLMRLVGDLLLAGQIESGQLSLDLTEVDMSELARETAELISAQAAGKRIDVSLQADQPEVVRGDRARLHQLLDNLATNAVKYTPEDGRVRITVTGQDGSCRVLVSDTGIGIPPEDRPHMFQRFFRASSAAKHGIGGTGLGLAISKAIAEAHGGTLRLGEQDGPGTVFVVELPLAVREEAPA